MEHLQLTICLIHIAIFQLILVPVFIFLMPRIIEFVRFHGLLMRVQAQLVGNSRLLLVVGQAQVLQGLKGPQVLKEQQVLKDQQAQAQEAIRL